MKISIARLKEIIMEEVARATLVETDSDCEEAEEDNAPVPPLELEEEIEIVDDE
tara:strand:+ start:564 stop:725 length:162 start_codon:yes stop_codon:yes gene_type:complete